MITYPLSHGSGSRYAGAGGTRSALNFDFDTSARLALWPILTDTLCTLIVSSRFHNLSLHADYLLFFFAIIQHVLHVFPVIFPSFARHSQENTTVAAPKIISISDPMVPLVLGQEPTTIAI